MVISTGAPPMWLRKYVTVAVAEQEGVAGLEFLGPSRDRIRHENEKL